MRKKLIVINIYVELYLPTKISANNVNPLLSIFII